MAAFLTATSRLFIDALQGPDDQGYFRLEHNTEQNNNPHGSTFESIHHLFCNITDPPLHVLVAEPVVGTRMINTPRSRKSPSGSSRHPAVTESD